MYHVGCETHFHCIPRSQDCDTTHNEGDSVQHSEYCDGIAVRLGAHERVSVPTSSANTHRLDRGVPR